MTPPRGGKRKKSGASPSPVRKSSRTASVLNGNSTNTAKAAPGRTPSKKPSAGVRPPVSAAASKPRATPPAGLARSTRSGVSRVGAKNRATASKVVTPAHDADEHPVNDLKSSSNKARPSTSSSAKNRDVSPVQEKDGARDDDYGPVSDDDVSSASDDDVPLSAAVPAPTVKEVHKVGPEGNGEGSSTKKDDDSSTKKKKANRSSSGKEPSSKSHRRKTTAVIPKKMPATSPSAADEDDKNKKDDSDDDFYPFHPLAKRRPSFVSNDNRTRSNCTPEVSKSAKPDVRKSAKGTGKPLDEKRASPSRVGTPRKDAQNGSDASTAKDVGPTVPSVPSGSSQRTATMFKRKAPLPLDDTRKIRKTTEKKPPVQRNNKLLRVCRGMKGPQLSTPTVSHPPPWVRFPMDRRRRERYGARKNPFVHLPAAVREFLMATRTTPKVTALPVAPRMTTSWSCRPSRRISMSHSTRPFSQGATPSSSSRSTTVS